MFLLILPRNYLNDDWCQEWFQQAQIDAIEGRHHFNIILTLDGITLNDLPDETQKFVKTHPYSYIQVPDDMDQGNFKQKFQRKLLYVMPHVPLKYLQDRDVEMQDMRPLAQRHFVDPKFANVTRDDEDTDEDSDDDTFVWFVGNEIRQKLKIVDKFHSTEI